MPIACPGRPPSYASIFIDKSPEHPLKALQSGPTPCTGFSLRNHQTQRFQKSLRLGHETTPAGPLKNQRKLKMSKTSLPCVFFQKMTCIFQKGAYPGYFALLKPKNRKKPRYCTCLKNEVFQTRQEKITFFKNGSKSDRKRMSQQKLRPEAIFRKI